MIRRALIILRRTLADQRGDSMVEALAAILIAALGATMLATMVMTSVSMTARSERMLSDSYAAESSLLSSSPANGTLKVTIPDSGAVDIKVVLYRSGEYEYYSEGRLA